MSWLARLMRSLRPHRYRHVRDLNKLGEGLVQVEGRVEALDLLNDPIAGDPCVIIGYRAWPPSTTVGVDGATAHNSRAFELQARQAVDFLLKCDGGDVLVQVERGRDISDLHRSLLERYGVGLRAEAEVITPGSRIAVAGRVVHRRGQSSSPHRSEPYDAIVSAERLWVIQPRSDE